jgi:DNA-binding NtrC family response regulator
MAESALKDLLGSSPQMERVRRFVRRAGRTDVPVLITGETGTGKTLLARLIHSEGRRRRAPFVPLNCAGIPDTLFEAEFFGHRRGAFTGAVESRRGLIEAAHTGTLFLDEVGDLPLPQQAKLLTVLEEGRVRRVGEDRWQEVDVRILSATSRNVPQAMVEGRFRTDLYHRIALLRCTIPPLRERREDVLFLAERFLRRFAAKHGSPVPVLDGALRARLLAHPWPGNIRELAHVLEAALILAEGGLPGSEHLDEAMALPGGPDSPGIQDHGAEDPEPRRCRPPGKGRRVPPAPGEREGPDGPDAGVGGATDRGGERERILRALEDHGGDRARAARDLGMPRSTLRDRILRYGLDGVTWRPRS